MNSSPLTNPPEILQKAADLLQAGQHPEAAAALRRAMDLAPASPAVRRAVARLSTLARTWLTLGQVRLALDTLAPLAESAHADGTLLMLYGYALMAVGRKDDAEAVLRRWLAKDPGNRDATLRLAAVLSDNGKAIEAEAVIRSIARGREDADVAFVLGRALLEQARFDEAETQFRKVVQARPEHQIAHGNLMELVWMRTGDVHEASREIDKVLHVHADSQGLRITKARLLTSARLPREALAAIDIGLQLAPSAPALLTAAATIALDLDGTRALDYAKRLHAIAPHDRATQVAVGNASLATGHAQEALEIAEALHKADPTDGRALAMKADALRMLGDPRYRELLDYQHLVRAEPIDVPAGWSGLEAYLAELVADLERAQTLRAHPIGNSLREGSQIHLAPQNSPSASIRALPQAIDGPIRRYMQAVGVGDDPMRNRNTGRYGISGMWSVRLRPHGFHVSHYHPEGWISSACYLHLPHAVDRGGEGWLKFGEPAFPTNPLLEPEYFVKPSLGLLVLFPSYMWHGTVPFSGTPEDRRLTIAFDVEPLP
ncbi:MAG TPA: tetratricopeptide repeat protein [Rhodanobacteraceae bacterium]|nr:tetratricopeptide repeat protein [Rhodanobacteraceae bacterium]